MELEQHVALTKERVLNLVNLHADDDFLERRVRPNENGFEYAVEIRREHGATCQPRQVRDRAGQGFARELMRTERVVHSRLEGIPSARGEQIVRCLLVLTVAQVLLHFRARLLIRRLFEQKIFPGLEFERHRHPGADKRRHANDTAHLLNQLAQGGGVAADWLEQGDYFVVSGHNLLHGVSVG